MDEDVLYVYPEEENLSLKVSYEYKEVSTNQTTTISETPEKTIDSIYLLSLTIFVLLGFAIFFYVKKHTEKTAQRNGKEEEKISKGRGKRRCTPKDKRSCV